MQKHLLRLENCLRDGSRQYLIIRQRKKAFSVYLLHIERKGTQSMKLLSKIPMSALNLHDSGQLGPGNLDSFRRIVLEHVHQELALVTEALNRQKKK